MDSVNEPLTPSLCGFGGVVRALAKALSRILSCSVCELPGTMKPPIKIVRMTERLLSGYLRAHDLACILLYLRDHSTFVSIEEIGHTIAHYGVRDRGFTTKQTRLQFESFFQTNTFKAKKGTIDKGAFHSRPSKYFQRVCIFNFTRLKKEIVLF